MTNRFTVSVMQLRDEIQAQARDCRERSLALTKLQECWMWLDQIPVRDDG